MQWGPLLPKGGGIIQVDIGCYLPIPLAQNKFSHLGSFSMVFRVLNLWGHFEGLKNVLYLLFHLEYVLPS
jgi:hypothetical protein